MITLWLIVAAALAALTLLSRRRGWVVGVGALFCAVQAGMAAAIFAGAGWLDALPMRDLFFTPDRLGRLFFALLALIAPMVFWTSCSYLKEESRRHFRLYHLLLMLLCASLAGLYFADNVAVTWIFVELTTLATAGLVYHRRTPRALEATWKYLFVCSVGIAIAYLGILLLSTAVHGELSYAHVAAVVAGGNPLYMQIAYLLIFIGYSCKMELFPLYSVGIDANSSAPTPASALVSTGLVGGGFVAIFRIYQAFAPSPVFEWVRGVMVVAGVASLLMGALMLRRTNHLKRLLSYSTLENMGIVLIGLGVGGAGVVTALLHVAAHSLLKAGLFLQAARIGKIYGTYRLNRIGGYMGAEPVGAVTLIVLGLLAAAFPPSPLFLSELMIFTQIIEQGRWWLLAAMVLPGCVVIYNLANRLLQIAYHPASTPAVAPARTRTRYLPLVLLLGVCALGVWQGGAIMNYLNGIVR